MSSRQRRAGFTIVELLVVIAVIAALMGILLPALSGAQRRARKADEQNRLRQVGIAWNLYAQSNKDSALPGFLSSRSGPGGDNVQEAWRVDGRYKFPDGEPVPARDAEQWPWRLLAYLDFDQDALMGHVDLPQQSQLAKKEMGDYSVEDVTLTGERFARPEHIARQPGFGYNAFYVGGWWDQWVDVSDGGSGPRFQPRPRFHQARTVTERPEDSTRMNVIAKSPSTINDPARMVLFCSAAAFSPGEYHRIEDQWPGSHFVVPPYLAEVDLWRKSTSSDSIIEVTRSIPGVPPMNTAIPVARNTKQAAVLHADLHSASEAPGVLDDMRYWVNGADKSVWLHTE
jgi:prepilin-type N-terminal cleavage/methylation domain-containing protein